MEPGGQPYFAWFYRKVLVYFAVNAPVVLACSVLAALRLHCCCDYNCEGPKGQIFAPNQCFSRYGSQTELAYSSIGCIKLIQAVDAA